MRTSAPSLRRRCARRERASAQIFEPDRHSQWASGALILLVVFDPTPPRLGHRLLPCIGHPLVQPSPRENIRLIAAGTPSLRAAGR